jgi:hypothetical protein
MLADQVVLLLGFMIQAIELLGLLKLLLVQTLMLLLTERISVSKLDLLVAVGVSVSVALSL